MRRELGQRLRGLRTARDMTVAEAAERAGFSQSKLTKIELAQAVATRDDVLKMLGVYEETDPQQQDLLLAMVRAGATKEWWEGHRALPPKFGSYLGLESVATVMQAYETTWCTGCCRPPTTPARCSAPYAPNCCRTRSTSSSSCGCAARRS